MNPSLDPVTLSMVGDISPYITTIAIYIYNIPTKRMLA